MGISNQKMLHTDLKKKKKKKKKGDNCSAVTQKLTTTKATRSPEGTTSPRWSQAVTQCTRETASVTHTVGVRHPTHLSWVIRWSSRCCSAVRRTEGRPPSARPRSRLRTRTPSLRTPWRPRSGPAWEEVRPSPTGLWWYRTWRAEKEDCYLSCSIIITSTLDEWEETEVKVHADW